MITVNQKKILSCGGRYGQVSVGDTSLTEVAEFSYTEERTGLLIFPIITQHVKFYTVCSKEHSFLSPVLNLLY